MTELRRAVWWLLNFLPLFIVIGVYFRMEAKALRRRRERHEALRSMTNAFQSEIQKLRNRKD